jgi:(1->4)-alpha-D-glucan 1-alpha-D-glucosylmutase
MKLQQYSGPVMAKGLEDTAFYRYNRLVALNQVGGHPDEFGISSEAFHRANRLRAERWPNAMLGTSTHDTKRGDIEGTAPPERDDEYLFIISIAGWHLAGGTAWR